MKILVFLLLLSSTFAYYVKLDEEQKSFCFYINKDVLGGKHFNLRFSFSDKNPENCKAKVVEITKEGKRNVLFTKGPSKNIKDHVGKYNHEVKDDIGRA